MRSWLVALRIARREARRAKGRTLLIVAMIALPVAALSFAAATYDAYKLTPEETITRHMGAADAYIDWIADDSILEPTKTDPATTDPSTPATPTPPKPHTAAALLALLPTGSRATQFWSGGVGLHTAHGFGELSAYGIDMADPITHGMVRIDSGRAPRADNEVLVSPDAVARLGTHVGGVITTIDDGSGPGMFPAHTYTVVGIGELGGGLQEYVLFRPSQMPDRPSWLVSMPGPVTEAQVKALGGVGISVTSRELLLHPPADAPQPPTDQTVAGFSLFGVGTLISGLGLLEVVLLAGPAFAVGARRRQRDLALVATTGGTPSTLRRIVLADGIVGGVAAAVVGLIAGLAVAALSRSFLEENLVHQRFGTYRVYPLAIAGIVGLALLTGLAGALVPAVTAGRQDVVAALTGRRGSIKSRAIWVVLGVIGIAVGAAVAFLGAYRHDSNIVLAGLVLGEFGIVLCTPMIIGGVAKFGRFLPVSPRIALRDTARRRSAAAPAISAVMAAVAGSVALTVYLGASSHRGSMDEPQIPIGSVLVNGNFSAVPAADRATEMAKVQTILHNDLPGSTIVTITSIDMNVARIDPELPAARKCPYQNDQVLSKADQRKAAADPRCAASNSGTGHTETSPMVTTDPAVLAATLGLQGSDLDAAVAAVNAGKVVVNDARFIEDGMITVTVTTYTADGNTDSQQSRTLPAFAVPAGQETALAMSPATSTALHLTTGPMALLATPPHAPTTAQSDTLQADLLEGNLPEAVVETGPDHDKQIVAIILAIAAAVIALGAAAIATGLAAVDGRADLRTLGAVGATPRVRRMLALSQSGVIAGLGSVLGALAGFGAGAAVVFGLNQVYATTWPAPIPYPIVVPWLNLGVSVVAVPLVAMIGAGLLTRSRLPIERRAD
jgi:putative ABC transport system permease protein